jgi:hypothetical protein
MEQRPLEFVLPKDPQGLRVPEAMERLEALESEREKLLLRVSKVQASIESSQNCNARRTSCSANCLRAAVLQKAHTEK